METPHLLEIIALILALLIAIVGHEIMHGYVAYLYGDTTAKSRGRLSINPLVHIDLIGTIVVPALLYFSNAPFMFGWAKPVPINISTVFRNGGYKAAIYVSLAGIAYNLALACISWVLLHLFFPNGMSEIENYVSYFFTIFLVYSMTYNIVLGLFNLYPIPPLDGSHALMYISAYFGWKGVVTFYESMERYGMVILLIFIATPLSQYFFMPIRYVLQQLL